MGSVDFSKEPKLNSLLARRNLALYGFLFCLCLILGAGCSEKKKTPPDDDGDFQSTVYDSNVETKVANEIEDDSCVDSELLRQCALEVLDLSVLGEHEKNELLTCKGLSEDFGSGRSSDFVVTQLAVRATCWPR